MLDYQVNGRAFERIGNRSRQPDLAPHGMYRCAAEGADDDRWIAIACEQEEQWRAICDVLELVAVADDPRFVTNAARLDHQDDLDTTIEARTRGWDQRELMYALQARGVPAGATQNIADKMERDEQLEARGFYQTAPHAELGEHRFEGYPARFSRARWRLDRGAPAYGEDTVEVLRDLLGFSDEEIARMQSELAV
jgi:crotonobetainyl-CoA:carnitine CoA-transferase CaiB-like acyl-CoA transferase